MAGQQLLINEVQPSNHGTIATGEGRHPDWVELVSRATGPVDLQGHVLSLGLQHHRFTRSLVVPPKGVVVLWCDGHAERGADHVDLRLSREGGTLLLIAPDRSTVLDLFTWKAVPPDASVGRTGDDGRGWCVFPRPTPGATNGPDTGLRGMAAAPALNLQGDRLVVEVATDAEVRYTLDGSPVRMDDPVVRPDLVLRPSEVLRARAFAPHLLPGPEVLLTRPARDEPQGLISIAVADHLLNGDSAGIIAVNERSNFSRKGRAWQVPALVHISTPDSSQLLELGLAVAGSGSRGLPKRSFKLFARDRFGSEGEPHIPGEGAYREVFLRADAGPSTYLRNVFMEQLVLRAGLQVEVQPGVPLPLYLNGRYQGLYRLLPPKNAERFGRGEVAIDLVDGPAAKALKGDAEGYNAAIAALHRGAPLDSLQRLMDLQSLVDLAAIDLYTGRADHDLNMRAWRPRTPDGRWRWVLFDMDLWSLPAENTVERMCSAGAPEAPYLGALFAHDATRQRLLARTEALLLTALAPAEASSLLDSIATADAAALERDHARWAVALDRPSPQEAAAGIRAHIHQRPEVLLAQLAVRLGMGRSVVRFEAPPAGQGHLLIEGLSLPEGQQEVRLLRGVPLHVVAVAAPGWEFSGWSDRSSTSPVRDVLPGEHARVSPRFRPAQLRP